MTIFNQNYGAELCFSSFLPNLSSQNLSDWFYEFKLSPARAAATIKCCLFTVSINNDLCYSYLVAFTLILELHLAGNFKCRTFTCNEVILPLLVFFSKKSNLIFRFRIVFYLNAFALLEIAFCSHYLLLTLFIGTRTKSLFCC